MKRLLILAMIFSSCTPMKADMTVFSAFQVNIKKLFKDKEVIVFEGDYYVKADLKKRSIELELKDVKTNLVKKLNLKNIDVTAIETEGEKKFLGKDIGQQFDIFVRSKSHTLGHKTVSTSESCVRYRARSSYCYGNGVGCLDGLASELGSRTCHYDEIRQVRLLDISFLSREGEELAALSGKILDTAQVDKSCMQCL